MILILTRPVSVRLARGRFISKPGNIPSNARPFASAYLAVARYGTLSQPLHPAALLSLFYPW